MSTAFTTRPGTPRTNDPGGTFVPGERTAPAPITDPAHVDSVQQDRTHADHAAIFHGATVEDHPVSDRDAIANPAGVAGIGMNHRQVLNVGLVADRDRFGIPANHGVIPDARIAADRDVAEHGRAACEKRGRVDPREWGQGIGRGHAGSVLVESVALKPRNTCTLSLRQLLRPVKDHDAPFERVDIQPGETPEPFRDLRGDGQIHPATLSGGAADSFKKRG